MKLYCTQAGRMRELAAKPTLQFYVCGITPYDSMHVGHLAMFLTYDVLARRMQQLGSEVRIIRNITDVDDPLLPRAQELGIPYWDLVESEVTQYHSDVRALGLLPSLTEARASEHVEQMAAAVVELLERGHAYRLGDSVYFSVQSDPEFGSLSRLDQSTMIELSAERGGDPTREGKRHPLDFVLWQPSRPGEPEYDTVVGKGRPGWHIGCSIMSREHLGTIDLHGGGEDLIFPHHECENAQNRTIPNGSRVDMWVHAAFVSYDGHKMSKSLGNIVLARDLLKEHDPRALRLAVLANYRHRVGMDWHNDYLTDAAAMLQRWSNAAKIGNGPDPRPFENEFFERLDNGLEIPEAVAALDRYAQAINESPGTEPAGAALARMTGALGIDLARPA